MIMSSDKTTPEKEVKHIKTVMASKYGYPKQFVDKAIQKQMKKKRNILTPEKKRNDDKEHNSMQTATSPLLMVQARKSGGLRTRSADIRCTFLWPNSTPQLYAVKDRLPTNYSTHVVCSIRCNTWEEECIVETMRALNVCCKVHRGVTRLEIGCRWACTGQRQSGTTWSWLAGGPWARSQNTQLCNMRERSERHSK